MAKQTTPTENTNPISPQSYAAFIGQIELHTIWLSEARVRNYYGPDAPDRNSVRISSSAKWESTLSGFRAFAEYKVRLKSDNTPSLDLDVTYGLDFASSEPMTDNIFMIFRDVNLPVNTWPYLREFVSTTMGRMHWTPFTLPAFKTGTEQPARVPRAKRASATRARTDTQTTK